MLARAKLMEEEGQRIIKLNIGNLAPFGFDTPDEVRHDVIVNLPQASGYSDSKGLFAARKAIMHYTQEKGIAGVGLDDIFVGNGVSELIVMAMQGLLDDGDEVLVPAPDYPLWTAAVSLAGGRARHYLCDEGAGWLPDLADIASKITERTRAIVIINPNNPTGALYPPDLLREIVEIARRHQLIVFADEIYDKTLYDGATHTSIASLADDVLFVDLQRPVEELPRLRLPQRLDGDLGRQAPRAGLPRGAEHPRLDAPVRERARPVRDPDGAGRLPEHQRPGGAGRAARPPARPRATTSSPSIPGVTCVKPKAALYLFPRLDPARYPIERRPAVRARAARGGEGAGRAGQRLQLARPGSLPRRSSCRTATISPTPSAASPTSSTATSAVTPRHETAASRPARHRHRRARAPGTVLRRNEEEIARRAGRPIRITWIAERSARRRARGHARRAPTST